MAKFSFSKKYNTERLFDIDTTNFDYFSLEDKFEADKVDVETGEELHPVYTVRGVYINTKGLYDPAPVIALDDCYINLPAHLTDTCKEMLNDREAIRAINEGHCGIRIYKYYQARYNKDCYSVEWIDI